MTCSIAWFEPITKTYGVIADQQFVGSPYQPMYHANKLAQITSHKRDPLYLAFAGDYARIRHVQRWLESGGGNRVVQFTADVEQVLLDIHAYASDGPKKTGLDPATGESGVHVAAAHSTGLYWMEGAAAVYHTPATQCVGRARVACVGTAQDFVAGLMHGGLIADTMNPEHAYIMISRAHFYTPHSVGSTVDAFTYVMVEQDKI